MKIKTTAALRHPLTFLFQERAFQLRHRILPLFSRLSFSLKSVCTGDETLFERAIVFVSVGNSFLMLARNGDLVEMSAGSNVSTVVLSNETLVRVYMPLISQFAGIA